MRKCRNWQTSKTKDLVSIALVWVQVPSSALFNRMGSLIIQGFLFFAYNQIGVTTFYYSRSEYAKCLKKIQTDFIRKCIYAQKILCKKLLSPAKCSSGKRSFYFLFYSFIFAYTTFNSLLCGFSIGFNSMLLNFFKKVESLLHW